MQYINDHEQLQTLIARNQYTIIVFIEDGDNASNLMVSHIASIAPVYELSFYVAHASLSPTRLLFVPMTVFFRNRHPIITIEGTDYGRVNQTVISLCTNGANNLNKTK